MRRIISSLAVVLAALVVVGGLSLAAGGTTSSATRPRLERSIAATFANQYLAQAALLGRIGVSRDTLAPQAMCDKHGPAVADVGAGSDWICLIGWTDPNVPMPPEGYGKFEVAVKSNDCFTATGPSKLVGFSMLTDKRGQLVNNPAFEFDGCFDPAADNTATGVSFPSVLNVSSAVLTPDASGHVAVQLTCGTGAAGCAGSIAVSAGDVSMGTITYHLAEEATMLLPVAMPVPASAAAVTFTFTPTVGMAPTSPSTVPLQVR